jgi:hypothetical protein
MQPISDVCRDERRLIEPAAADALGVQRHRNEDIGPRRLTRGHRKQSTEKAGRASIATILERLQSSIDGIAVSQGGETRYTDLGF